MCPIPKEASASFSSVEQSFTYLEAGNGSGPCLVLADNEQQKESRAKKNFQVHVWCVIPLPLSLPVQCCSVSPAISIYICLQPLPNLPFEFLLVQGLVWGFDLVSSTQEEEEGRNNSLFWWWIKGAFPTQAMQHQSGVLVPLMSELRVPWADC